MLRNFISCILIAALASSSCFAQAQPSDEKYQKIKEQVEKMFDRDARVKINLVDGRKLQGSISEVSSETFVITDGACSLRVPYADVRKIKRQSDPRTRKIAITLAVAAGIIGLAVAFTPR